jgi:hypothetical protein
MSGWCNQLRFIGIILMKERRRVPAINKQGRRERQNAASDILTVTAMCRAKGKLQAVCKTVVT